VKLFDLKFKHNRLNAL